MGEMDINDCWSLIAVVKECTRKAKLRAQLTPENTLTTTTTTTTTTTATTRLSSFETNYAYSQKQFCDQFVPSKSSAAADSSTSQDELKDFYTPFLFDQDQHGPIFSHNIKIDPVVEQGGMSSNLMIEQISQQQNLQLRNFQINKKQSSPAISVDHPKKKKFEDRRVVRFTLEELSRNDKWAWRKYGQKPIKGSPYPRNYYRCSSLKGCKARKQVERSPIDPNIYIVTYTGNHYHPCPPLRNSNGSRVKYSGSDPDPPPESKTGYGSGLGGNVMKIEDEEHGDEEHSGGGGGGGGDESFGSGEMDEGNTNDYEILIPNSIVDSDLLTGMEQLNGGGKISSSSHYNENVGFDEIKQHIKGCDPNVNMEVQAKESGLGYGVRIREIYATTPATLAGPHELPSSIGQNNWDNGMIRSQSFLF
ncbi:hypothetical protein BVRB_3g053220 [Beta vulgaris subsp. vulgaris]|nr:hypothetical protein BVRB_3g053220 [Beta vulgaris subsp. vulgaris]